MQPIVIVDGIARFKENAIVAFLAHGRMNELARLPFSREDHEQLAQLIGYSVSGFGDLSYASEETVAIADEAVERLLSQTTHTPDSSETKRNRK